MMRPDAIFVLSQRRRIGGGSRRQHDEEALFDDLLGYVAADTPVYADGQVAVVRRLSLHGHGTNAVARLTGKSKPCVWRWREHYVEEGVDGPHENLP
jgi:Homeodomain-like domain